jgi:predicted anti-sigma-YlaC factor YlaD
MRCAEMVELISAYADGQTTPAETQSIKAHLADCNHCRAVLRRQQQTRRLLHLVGDDTWTPPDLRLRVAQALRRPERARPRRWGVLSAAVAGIAALVVAIGLLGGQVLPQQAAPPPAAQPSHVVVHARANHCRICLTHALAQRKDLTRMERATLMAEALYATLPATQMQYPPLPPGWPSTASAGDTITKGGEDRQANVPSYHGLPAS